MKEKIPLKFVKTLPDDPIFLWGIIDSTIKEVGDDLALSVEEAKLRVYVNLIREKDEFSTMKLFLKTKITDISIVRRYPTIPLHYDVVTVCEELKNIELPSELLQEIAISGNTNISEYAIPEKYKDLFNNACIILTNSNDRLNNLSLIVDNSLPRITVYSIQELKIYILNRLIHGTNVVQPIVRGVQNETSEV